MNTPARRICAPFSAPGGFCRNEMSICPKEGWAVGPGFVTDPIGKSTAPVAAAQEASCCVVGSAGGDRGSVGASPGGLRHVG